MNAHAASSNAAGKRKASAALGAEEKVSKAALDNAIKHYELEAAKSAELQRVVYALQARNDNLEMANKQLDKSRNSLGCQLAYLDRIMPHNVDGEHKEIWQKIRRDSRLVAADAQAAAEEEEYNRVAQLGPPERVLGCPVPSQNVAGPAGGDATPMVPRGTALVDPHPPAPPGKKAKAARPSGIVSAKNVFTKTYSETFKAANPGNGKDHLAKLGEAYKALPGLVQEVFRVEAEKQAGANALRRSRAEETLKSQALPDAPKTLDGLTEEWAAGYAATRQALEEQAGVAVDESMSEDDDEAPAPMVVPPKTKKATAAAAAAAAAAEDSEDEEDKE